MKEILGVQDFIEKLLNDSGYADELRKENSIESQTRLENINEFISVAVDYERENPEGTIEDFLVNVSLLSDVDKTEDVDNAATMLTIHSSKGLEFPVIFLVGMEEGLFPSARSVESDKDIEEERRLCYVAITRAEERLFITFANTRTIYGRTNYTLPSRFVEEIPKELVETTYDEKKLRVNRSSKNTRFDSNISNDKYNKIVDKEIEEAEKRKEENQGLAGEITIATKVRHKKWGEGMIVGIKDTPNDKELTIAFENAGLKRIILSIAPIEIL